jgi:hypothetical protein
MIVANSTPCYFQRHANDLAVYFHLFLHGAFAAPQQ